MKAKLNWLIGACLTMSGCTAVPHFTEDYPVSVQDVVANINCEISSLGEFPLIKSYPLGWTAGVTLNLKTFVSSGLNADAAVSVPLSPGTLVATVGGAFTGSAEGTSVVEYQKKVGSEKCQSLEDRSSYAGLQGDLGVHDWFDGLQTSIRTNDLSPSKLSYTVQFIVEASGGLGPKFTVLPISTANLDIGAKLSGSKKQTHFMTLVPQYSTRLDKALS